jgi:adenylate kinase family enzyme
MGVQNFLIDGVSGVGKTTVAEELAKLGYHVVHGDRELKYRGDPITNEPIEEPKHESETDKAVWMQKHLLWDINKVQAIMTDHSVPMTFFCGGCRNLPHFIDQFDGVFILDVQDINILMARLDERVARDPTDWGGKPEEKEIVMQAHKTKEDIPQGDLIIDSTQPLDVVIKTILTECKNVPRARVRNHLSKIVKI